MDYQFISEDRFEEMVQAGEFLEWADVFGRRYGTPATPIESAREAGRDVVLEIDVQGAWQVKSRTPDAILIFLRPPTMAELERRLKERGTENEQAAEARLAKAGVEMGEASWFDHEIINDDLGRATVEVAATIKSYRPSSGRRRKDPKRDRRPEN